MINKKGFLLLEVMVSVAIIAGGLIFVTRVYSTAKNVLQRSSILFQSGLLLESQMFEFEEKGKIEEDFKEGKDFTDEKDYSWLINSTPTTRDPVLQQKLDINLVTMEVSRHRDREEKRSYVTKHFLTTYLKDKGAK